MSITENSDLLPRILCLHGGGTSSLIFTFQSRRLVKFLQPHFRLVFIDAPHECGPGPGVLPFFEGAGPYYQWVSKTEEEEEQVRERIEEALGKKDDDDDDDGNKAGQPFVGVIGFSQGARVAAGLLHQAEAQAHTQDRKGDGDGDRVLREKGLRFGVLMNGSYPPLRQSSNPSTILPRLSEHTQRDWNDRHEGVIHTPSIHVHGIRDPALPASKLLTKCFDPSSATVLEYDNGHHLPASDDDSKVIVDHILRVYNESLLGGGDC